MSQHLIDERLEESASAPAAARAVARQRSPVRLAVQATGFLLGLALLVWAILLAFSPENREQLAKLADASPALVVALLALNAATLLTNGVMFWLVLLPERRLRASDVIATNAVASFLALLPFKISVITRLAVHSRRDGIPLLMVTGWMAAFGSTLAVVFGPFVLASLAFESAGPAWLATSLAGCLVLLVITIGIARVFAGQAGLTRLHRVLDPLARGPLRRVTRSSAFANLHAVFGMLAHRGTYSGTAAIRLLDFGVQSARFVVAGHILGIELGFANAALLTATYYAISVVSPTGNLGTREAGTIGIAAALGIAVADGTSPIPVMVLLVTGSETIVNLVAALAGAAWIRLDRVLLGHPGSPTVPAAPVPASPTAEPAQSDR